MKESRVAVYIDGSNLFHRLRECELKNLTRFNYRGFSDWLARGRTVLSYRYYIGVVRAKEGNVKGQELRREQQRLFAHLTSPTQGFVIKYGWLMEYDGSYHEKGVDVNLAVDLLSGAYDDLYDVAVVMSSDTDLIPAIKKVKFFKKEVEYIGFSHRPSLALQRYATLSRLLITEDVRPFEVETLFPDREG